MNLTLKRRWLAGLTATVAVSYAAVGLAGQGIVRPAGVLGAAAILASLALARGSRGSRRAARVVLVLGITPLVALTWWSLATPLLAVCGLVVGWPRAADASDNDAADAPRPGRVLDASAR